MKMEEIRKVATDFAHENWGKVAGNKEGMELIGIELFQELTMQMVNYQGKKTNLISKIPKNTFLEDLEEVYKQKRFPDGEYTFQNETDKCQAFHKAIIAAHSKQLFDLISQSKTKQISIPGLSPVAVSDFMQFIYFGRTSFNPVGSCEIIEFALNQFSLREFRDPIYNSIMNGITIQNVLPILRVTYLPQANFRTIQKLRQTVLQFITENFNEINMIQLRKLQPSGEIGFQMMADVMDALYFAQAPQMKSNPSKVLSKSTSVLKLSERAVVSSADYKDIKADFAAGNKKKHLSSTANLKLSSNSENYANLIQPTATKQSGAPSLTETPTTGGSHIERRSLRKKKNSKSDLHAASADEIKQDSL